MKYSKIIKIIQAKSVNFAHLINSSIIFFKKVINSDQEENKWIYLWYWIQYLYFLFYSNCIRSQIHMLVCIYKDDILYRANLKLRIILKQSLSDMNQRNLERITLGNYLLIFFLIPPAMRSSFQYFLTFSGFLKTYFSAQGWKETTTGLSSLSWKRYESPYPSSTVNVLPIFGWTRLATFEAWESLGTEPVLGNYLLAKTTFPLWSFMPEKTISVCFCKPFFTHSFAASNIFSIPTYLYLAKLQIF